MADFGYAFANVDPLTKIDDDKKTVDLTFFINPGKRDLCSQYRLQRQFEKTNDQTLRREMRQFEGAPYSRRAVQRSRTRLARLPFMQDVKVNTKKVPGSDDLVDVDYDVSERAAGQINAGIGYSDAEGFLINGGVTHSELPRYRRHHPDAMLRPTPTPRASRAASPTRTSPRKASRARFPASIARPVS